jgi:hypothetical protein
MFLKETPHVLIEGMINELELILLREDIDIEYKHVQEAKELLLELKQLKTLSQESNTVFSFERKLWKCVRFFIVLCLAFTGGALFGFLGPAGIIIAFCYGYMLGWALQKYENSKDIAALVKALEREKDEMPDAIKKCQNAQAKKELQKIDEKINDTLRKLRSHQ